MEWNRTYRFHHTISQNGAAELVHVKVPQKLEEKLSNLPPCRAKVGEIYIYISDNSIRKGQLTLQDLSEVRGALYETRAKWYDIGIELKLSVGTLNTNREEFPHAAHCLREMCIHWLKHIDPCPSWAALTKALESPPVGKGHLAQQLRDKYCQGGEVIAHVYLTPEPSPPCAPPTSQVPLSEYESYHLPLGVILLLLIRSGDIEANPGPVGLEDLKYLHSELHPVSDKWYSLGVQLQVPIENLKCIRRDYPTVSECLLEMLTSWLKCTNSPPTWEALAKALESPPLGERHLAQQLRDKYCRGGREVIPHIYPTPGPSPPVAPPTPQVPLGEYESHHLLPQVQHTRTTPQGQFFTAPSAVPLPSPTANAYPAVIPSTSELTTLPHHPTPGHTSEYEQQQNSLQDQTREQQVTIVPLKTQELENKFLDIARRTTDRIRMKNMDTEEFRLQFIVQMEISKQDQHRQFIENYLMEVKPTTTVGDLLCRLSMYWNFLNYNLLQHLVDMLGDEQLKHDMEDYVEALKAFRANTKLCDFIKNWPLRGRKPPEADLRELVIKKVMDKKWEECTLEDVEMVEETLTHKFLLPDFVLRFGDAEKGSLCLTWYIPAPIAKTLHESMLNIETEFFKTHRIERVTIDGAECFLTPVKKFANYLKGVYTSEKPLPTVESSLPADKPLPFYLAKIERKLVNPDKADKFIRASIRGDVDDVVWQKKPMNVDEVGVLPDGSQPKLVLIEGAPGVGKTTFSWDFCTKWARGEALQEYSLVVLLPLRDNRLKEATSLSDLFYHPDPNIQKAVLQEVERTRGKGVLIWLEAFDELVGKDKKTRSSIFLDLIYGKVLHDSSIFLTSRPWATATIAEKCKDRISQHIEILASADLQINHYMEKRKSDPSTSAKFRDYLSSNPAVKAMMYTPVTADMVTKMFLFSRVTESPPPTTMTELYTTFTQTLLLQYLNSHPVHGREQRKTLTFDDLPDDIHKYFTKLCELAYGGILNGHQLVFPADQVDFDSLCLMQETPQLYIGSPSSFHFLHLTMQEYLAAVHISQLPPREQTEVIEQHLRHGHFRIVFRFLAGRTKLKNLTQNIKQLLCGHDDDKLTLFHLLFESHSDVTTVNVPCSKEMCITFQHTWTPLDFYVTGYCVAHSQCNWSLRSHAACIDDEKVELFSKGCSCDTSSRTTDSGCISSIRFGGNYFTSEGIRHSLNVPQHIRQDIRELSLLDNKLDAHACELLAKVVPKMPMLEELNIVHNPDIGNGGAVALIRSLYTSRLKILKLHHTGIGKEDCVCLSQLSKSSHHLKYLYITDNNLSSESVELITRGVAHSSSLTKLDMSWTPLSMEAIVDLASLLSEQADCKLEKLVLGDCHISSEGAEKLAEALRKNTTLRKLYLSRNPIGERVVGVHVVGVTAIATMLVENKSLTKLGLEGCHISGQGAGELAAALCKNTTLRTLDLTSNPIGEQVVGVTAIATMLVENKSLTHLGLRDCHISGQGAGKLAAELYKNSTLQFLDLDHNPIGVEGASSMSGMLQHNKSLRQLYMSDDSVGEEGVHQLMHSVKSNQTLKHLQLPMKYKSEPSDNRILWR